MDKFFDVLFDPRVIAAGLVGWTLRGVLENASRGAQPAPQPQSTNVRGMAGTLFQRQATVAREHALKRMQGLADDRTRQFVDTLFPTARSKDEQKIIQLTVPK